MTVNTKNLHIVVSSFDVDDDVLEACAIGVCMGLQCKLRSPYPPLIIHNADDDFYGKSIDIDYKYPF